MSVREHDCCRTTSPVEAPACPGDGCATRPVRRLTVASLVADDVRSALRDEPYFFCSSPTCEVVYVSARGDHVIAKSQLTVRVGCKEARPPVPVCYCFGYTREQIIADIRARGDTDIQRVITDRVKAGECHCESANPSGRCCLGDVARAIKVARSDLHRNDG